MIWNCQSLKQNVSEFGLVEQRDGPSKDLTKNMGFAQGARAVCICQQIQSYVLECFSYTHPKMWQGDRSDKGIFQSKIRKINMKKIEPMLLNTNVCSYRQLAVQHESGRAIFYMSRRACPKHANSHFPPIGIWWPAAHLSQVCRLSTSSKFTNLTMVYGRYNMI